MGQYVACLVRGGRGISWRKGIKQLAVLLVTCCHIEPVMEQVHQETNVVEKTDCQLEPLARSMAAVVIPCCNNLRRE